MARTGYHYIPRPDGNFDAFVAQYFEQVDAWWSSTGLDKSVLDPLKDAVLAWNSAYPAHTAAQAAAEGARRAKDAARAEVERQLRPITNFLQSYPTMTDADRATFGITVRDGQRTAASAPATAPMVSVEPGGRLTHQLRLVDASTPTRRGKPRGTTGAEVWVRLIDAGQPTPTDPKMFSYLSLATRTTLRTDFPVDAGGKTAVYMLRWVSTRGAVGPWSDVVTGTVAA